MQNISLRSSGMRRKQNFDILTFTFRFLSSLLFSLFLPHFFSLAGHLVGFISVGRVFRKTFRSLGLGERKGRWVMEQDFHGDFQVLVRWFFASFSGVLDWIVLILVRFERSLHSAQVSEESCPWPLKLMTSQRVERIWILTGGYGRFRGEWVNQECQCSHNYYIRRSIKYDSKTNEQEHYSSRDSQRKVEPRYNKPLHNEVLGKTNKFFFFFFLTQ